MTYITERKVLANELAKTQTGSKHSAKEIERALAAFIDPLNPKMKLANFLKLLTEAAIGDGNGGMTAADDAAFQALTYLHDSIKNARLFNATYLGHMLSEASIPGMLGYMLAMRIGSNTVAREVSVFESKLEPDAIRELLEIVGFDPGKASGTFTSGGTMAMMTALTVARKLMVKEFHEKRADSPESVIVLTSPLAHYSITNICDLLGGPRKQIRLVHVDIIGKDRNNDHLLDFRMSVDDLRKKIISAQDFSLPVMAIIAIAGETETGQVDDLNAIASVAEEFKIRLIVDGAYGAPYKLSEQASHRFSGIEKAFAITLDPHKALYTPYSNGAVLFKNLEHHAVLAYGRKAGYLGFSKDLPEIIKFLDTNNKATGNLGQKRIEGSMGAGPILSTLSVLKTLGRGGLATIYDLTLDRTRHLYNKIKEYPDLLVPIHEPHLNLLCFTLSGNSQKKLGIKNNNQLGEFVNRIKIRLDHEIRGSGGFFFSTTPLPINLRGKTLWAWRACIMNPRTTNEIIEQAINSLAALILAEIKERETEKQSS